MLWISGGREEDVSIVSASIDIWHMQNAISEFAKAETPWPKEEWLTFEAICARVDSSAATWRLDGLLGHLSGTPNF